MVCLTCERFSRGEALCAACEIQLDEDVLPQPLCPDCGYPVDEQGKCGFCADYTLHASGAVSPWMHAGVARKLVHELKYEASEAAAVLLADAMAKAVDHPPENAVLTWVPGSAKNRRDGRIDHGHLLA